MKKKTLKRLTGWDWETLVASWRYFEHRHTIASAMFPGEIIERYFTGEYDQDACYDIARQFADVDHGTRGYDDWPKEDVGLGSLDCDRKVWCKFYAFCKAWHEDGFKTINCENDRGEKFVIEAFYCEPYGLWFPKNKYIEYPQQEYYIPAEYIKEIK